MGTAAADRVRRGDSVLTALLLALALVLSACADGADGAGEAEPGTGGETAPAEPEETDDPEEAAGAPPEDTGGDPAPEADADGEPEEEPRFVRLDGITDPDSYDGAFGESLEQWQAELPDIEDVRIPSSADDHEQPALWLPPTGDGPQPLLVTYHTWSTGYLQHVNIPFGLWAREMGWAMIQPNFRGVNDNPEATGSDLAVQDVIDAIDYAVEQADVDEDRVYGIGFSGGGMMSLLMAGRHPERFAGAAAWTPNYDLVDWYEHHVAQGDDQYPGQIAASCGGDPTDDEAAREECLHRSPADHLDGAREAGLPIFIAHGLDDGNVPPDQGARAFNQLADEEDRLDAAAIEAIAANELPEDLQGEMTAEHFFTENEPEVYFARESAGSTLVLFDGGHDMVYHPALEWMVRGAAARP